MHVVLVHGLGGTAATMAPLATVLRDHGVTSTSLLLPGHGTSPADLATTTWTDWLDAVIGACTAGGRGVDAVVGQSLGGALALAAAAAGAPTRAVVSINGPHPDPDAVDGIEWRMSRGHTTVDAVLGDGEAGYDAIPLVSLLEMSRGLLATDLAAVTAPTLLLQGLDDEVVDPAGVDVLAAHLTSVPPAGPRIERLAGVGHVATLSPAVTSIAASVMSLLGEMAHDDGA